MPFHGLFGGGGGHSIGAIGHHHSGGGGGHHHSPAHGHSHSHSHDHFRYLPLLFYGAPGLLQSRNPRNPVTPPPTPHNTVLTIATTEGELKTQHYVPEEAGDLLDVNELNQVITRINQLLQQTMPSQLILIIITILMIIGMIYLSLLVEEPEDGEDFFLSLLFGFCVGIAGAQFPIGMYMRLSLESRKKRINDYLEQSNHQLFLTRGCHWEEVVPLNNPNCVYLFLIEHSVNPHLPRIVPSAPPIGAEASTHIPIAVATIEVESVHYIEQPSAPLLSK